MDKTIASFMEYVYRRGGASMGSIMSYLGICERTVRTYVRTANNEFSGIASIKKQRGGDYHVRCLDQAAFERELGKARRGESGVYQDSESRLLFALATLMGDGDWVRTRDMRLRLFVSSSTMTAILKDVASACSEFGLRLARSATKGSRIEGPEFNKRLCLESTVVSSRCTVDRYLNIVGLDSDPLMRLADAFFRRTGVVVSEVARRDFILSASLVLLRSGSEPPLMLPDDLSGLLGLPRFTSMASSLQGAFRDVMGQDVCLTECAFVVMHLAFWCDLNEPLGGTSDVLATQLMECLDRTFLCGLSSDRELHEAAANHFRLLFLRMLYKTPTRLDPIQGVREYLPFSYVLANETCRLIESRSGRRIPDGECGSIAFIFARSLARKARDRGPLPVALVSSLGDASRAFLADRVRAELGAEAASFSGWDDNRLEGFDLTRLSCVLSTEDCNPPVPVPVVRVGHYLSDDDLMRVRRAKRCLSTYNLMSRSFTEARYDGSCKATTAHGALCDILSLLDLVDKEPTLCAGLLDCEGDDRMYYGNGVACVYGPQAADCETSLACAVLDEPVRWGSHDVDVVFALVLSREASETDAGRLLGAVCRLADRRDAVAVLRDADDHDARVRALSGLGEEPCSCFGPDPVLMPAVPLAPVGKAC